MKQCQECKYSQKVQEELWCIKKEIQHCVYQEGVQRLYMTNKCRLVNALNDCELFRPKKSFRKFVARLVRIVR